jgi:membrane-bound lytic murein transglycosylase A
LRALYLRIFEQPQKQGDFRLSYFCRVFTLIFIVILVAGCGRTLSRFSLPSAEPLSLISAEDIEFADDLDVDSLKLALERSIHYYDGAGRNNVYRLAGRLVGAQQMKESLLTFRQIINDGGSLAEKKKQIIRDFDVYRAAGQDGNGGVLFTGYYVPLLEGSLTRTEKYKYPLYKSPPELMDKKNSQSVYYYSRKEIDTEGVLQGKNLEIVWVADPVELFFLHIQGSGEIKLEDNTILTVSALQTNGRPYRSVPSYLLERGIISGRDASNHNIKLFLKEKNEQNLYEILGYNERYIFFHFVEKPTGSLAEPVTPGRTIATDPEAFPQGALAFIRLSKPVFDDEGNVKERIKFSRFVLNQDKGSAIKGMGRVDLFCGFGENAEAIAGSLKEKGELYFLIKK